MERKKLVANAGMVLTNGEIYGKVIYLSEGANALNFREITIEEYEKIIASTEQETI